MDKIEILATGCAKKILSTSYTGKDIAVKFTFSEEHQRYIAFACCPRSCKGCIFNECHE